MNLKSLFLFSSAATWFCLLAICLPGRTQTVNASQQLLMQGIRSNAGAGSFVAATYASDGTLFLLYDQHDGVRLLKATADGTSVLAQAQLGANGDAPVAMVLDPAGDLYVTGTTSSGNLQGTQGAVFPAASDRSINSFLAKYDRNLNLVFLTFLGSGKTAVTAIAATANAAFVTGITFNATFPVNASAIQQSPANGSSENGFVERFSADGSTLIYATYLTGANGNTMPGAIAADASDNAYIAGATTSSGYPTISALQPSILGATSGFLTSLSASGSDFNYSTFIAGSGPNSIALDASTGSLWLSGNVALGQFPVATVLAPLEAEPYQTLLRLPLNGQSVSSSILLVPGTASHVAVGSNGSAWVTGALGTPLFPGETAPNDNTGDSFLLHVTAANTIDQTMRFGGTPVNNAGYAALTSSLAAPAVSPDGTTIAIPGTLTASVDASLLATQRFDLPTIATPSPLLPSTVRDILSISCQQSSACTGTGGLLATISTTALAPSLALSTDSFPNVTVRNLSSTTATGLAIVTSGYTTTQNCGSDLLPSAQCNIALTGTGPGTLTISSGNRSLNTVALPANASSPDALALSTGELDFGIVTSRDGVITRTLTLTNLSASIATFSAAKDAGAASSSKFSIAASTCPSAGTAATFTIAANGTCQLTLGLSVGASSSQDGPVRALWKVGPRDVVLTAFAQAAALSVSATAVNFGTQFSGTTAVRLPRYLYLSNNASTPIAHVPVILPAASPFSVADACPSTLGPHSVCQIALSYNSSIAPSLDAVTLSLDDGVSILITGETLLPASVSGSTSNPNLSVSATQLSFATPVVVTAISGTTQTLTVRNIGQTALPLTVTTTGDFTLANGCPAALAPTTSCTLLITFAPSQPGARDGLLSLTAGSGFAPTLVTLTGTGLPLLPPNNGIFSLGQTFVGEPLVAWYKLQQSLASITASSSSPQFGVAIVEDTGSGHGTIAAEAFSQSVTSACGNCWLGIQYLSQASGSQAAQLTLTTTTGGSPYLLTLQASALPVAGLLLSPLSSDFGSVPVHSASAPTLFTLANMLSNASPVTVQSISATGDFSITANTSGGPSCTAQLLPTNSCNIQIAFAPTATGDRTGTLTVITSGGVVTASLVGYGLPDPGIAVSPTSLTFANVPGTTSTRLAVQLTNTSLASLTIGTPTVTDTSFIATSPCSTLAPGAACTITVGFLPQPATTIGLLNIPVTSTVNGQLLSYVSSVSLQGAYTSQGAGLQIVTNQANFGSIATGSIGPTRTFRLNNLSGKTLTVALDLPRDFPLASPLPCSTLAVGASCNFAISFLPSIGGPLTGTVLATGTPTDGSASVQTVAYMLGYGNASGSLSILGRPIPNSPISFGQVTSGQTAQQASTLSNNGVNPLHIRRLVVQPPFYATSNCGTALLAGQSCAVALTYQPINQIASTQTSAPRSDMAAITIESDSATSPDSLPLSGTALPVAVANPNPSALLNAYSLSTQALTFPNTPLGTASTPQSISLTNVGTTTIHLLSVASPPDYTTSTTCATMVPGAICTINVTLTPTTPSATVIRSGALQLLTDAANALEYVTVVGSVAAAPLTLTPASLDFGTVNVGSSDSLTLLVTNISASPVSFTSVTAMGDYTASSGNCPATAASLAAGASCSLNVVFAPTSTGTRLGTFSLATSATSLPLTAPLTGIGVQGQLQVTPGALAFGSIAVGAPASLTLTLLNAGTATVTNITNAISGPNASNFNVAVPCPVSSLAPNQGCTETVTFTPQATGQASATLSLSSSDPHGPATVSLSGIGIPGGAFTLTVNGANSATTTVVSGSPAAFALTLTPTNGFTGDVALTCTPIVAGPNATCSLDASTLTLNASPVNATATIETISSHVRLGFAGGGLLVLATFLLPRRRHRLLPVVAALSIIIFCLPGVGCGSGQPPSKLLYTPAGTYQYQVTAHATAGLPLSSTVTLNLVVR